MIFSQKEKFSNNKTARYLDHQNLTTPGENKNLELEFTNRNLREILQFILINLKADKKFNS